MTASEGLLDEICRYCNNYFNPKNDPAAPRDYPASFIELANHIAVFIAKVGERDNSVTTALPGGTIIVNLDFGAGQKMYAQDLAVYKRVKFI